MKSKMRNNYSQSNLLLAGVSSPLKSTSNFGEPKKAPLEKSIKPIKLNYRVNRTII